MTATDIKVGDLIKATHSDDPEVTITGRVTDQNDYWLWTTRHTFTRTNGWGFEVLERPEPPVEDELLEKAVEAYRSQWGFESDPSAVTYYGPAFTAVINTVREFDRNKEKK